VLQALTRLAAPLLAAVALAAVPAAQAADKVVVLEVEGGIGVATAEYVISGLEYAADEQAELVLINIDTPGGLVNAMRDIVTEILNSPVPVATYVTPAGARADSAGTYILLASHVAVMAPTTHLGAATPVSLIGEDSAPSSPFSPRPPEPPATEPAAEDTDGAGEAPAGTEEEETPAEPRQPVPGNSSMDRKVLNDAVSYIRNLAERHGRNADWAELAVTEAATLTATEALEQNVIDFIANDQEELLALVNDFETTIDSEIVAIQTGDTVVEDFEPNWRLKILQVIAQPEIVLLLGVIGVYGLLFEGYNPGAIVPGVVGVICLLLAAYALQLLPVNYAGLALIVVGIGLMVAEAFVPSFGALGLGGIAAFTFGAILMFDSGIPGFGVSVTFVIGMAVAAALFVIWLVGFLLKLQRRGAVSGRGSIVGGTGTALEDFEGDGKIWLEGEAWAAYSQVPIAKDQEVIVTEMRGLTLYVRPLAADGSQASLAT